MPREETDHRFVMTPEYGEVFSHYGIKWGVLRSGKTVCLGSAQNPPDSVSFSVTNPVPKINATITTTPPENGNFGTSPGRPKKEFPEKYIIKLANQGKAIRDIEDILKKKGAEASRSTIQRIIAGQKALV